MLLNKFLRFYLGPNIWSTFIHFHGHWRRKCILYKVPGLVKNFNQCSITLFRFSYFSIYSIKALKYVLRNLTLLMYVCQRLFVFRIVFISCILMVSCWKHRSFILFYLHCGFCPLPIKYEPLYLVYCTRLWVLL